MSGRFSATWRGLWAALATVAPRRMAIVLIRAYQRFISPLSRPSCRFIPTCSQYAAISIEKHGVLKGGAKAIWRLLRCHPFHPGGYDPP